MADGKTHRKYYEYGWSFIFISSIPASIGFGLLYNNVSYGILFFIFYFINYWKGGYINPDLDLLLLTESEWQLLDDAKKLFYPLKKYGKIGKFFSFMFGWILGFIAVSIISWWLLYAYIAYKHRSIWSHGWIIGTIGRMIHHNIMIMFIIFSFMGYEYNEFYIFVSLWIVPYLWSQFFTWFISDGIHLILDTEFAKGRLYTKKKRKRK